MVTIRPLRGRTVSSEWLNRVPSPAYDSFSVEERRAYRANNRWSYLNVTRSPEDEQPGAPTDNASLVAAASIVLRGLIADGAFGDETAGAMYLYRLEADGHVQTGIVAEAAVADYVGDGILAHEQIREARAELLADHLVGVGHASSPIALTFRSDEVIRDLLRAGREEHPLLDWNDGTLHQTVWQVADELADSLRAMLEPRTAYIIDGHHRAAAATAVQARNTRPPRTDHMLVALFPDDALQILGFNRVVRGLDKFEVQNAVAAIAESFSVSRLAETPAESSRGSLAMYASGDWYQIDLGTPAATDPLSGLDPVRLQDEILAPMFGVREPGSDPRLVTVSGDQPTTTLEEEVDLHGGVAFMVSPLEATDLFAVADAGQTMPPKSTYFVPKVRSGVFLRSVND